MKKMAIISPGYLPLPAIKGGAVETLIDLLINSEKVTEQFDIDVYSKYDSEINEESKNKNVNYLYINTDSKFNKVFKAFRYLINKYGNRYIGNDFISELIKKYGKNLNEYDYVIIENKPEYGLILRPYIKGKLIFHSHNDFLNEKTKYANRIVKCFDKIFCLSKYICSRIEKIDPKSKEKVELLYNGVDTEKFSGDNNKDIIDLRKKFNIKENDVVFLYTGRLVKEKGVLELINTFNKVTNKNYYLLIVGSVGYGKNFKNKFTKKIHDISKNNRNIIFTGFIPYEQMPSIYSMADYGIIPSMWEEPFALTVIEHLASGHPIIITNSGAMPELVSKDVAITIDKLYFEKEMLEAINNINTYRFYEKKKLIEYSKKFDKENYIDKFISLIDEGENYEFNK